MQDASKLRELRRLFHQPNAIRAIRLNAIHIMYVSPLPADRRNDGTSRDIEWSATACYLGNVQARHTDRGPRGIPLHRDCRVYPTIGTSHKI
jgi:hypothetical protein